MDIPVEWEQGAVLPVPVLSSSPFAFELETVKEISTGESDQTVFLCRIRNTLRDESLTDPALTPGEIYRRTAAVSTCGTCDYWSWDGRYLGKWHERAKEIKPDVEVGAAAQGN